MHELSEVREMEELDQYISGLFARMPDTSNRIELEDQVRDEAFGRYKALLDKGHSEAEALGLVIPRINEQEIRKQLEFGSKPVAAPFAARGYGSDRRRSKAETAEIELKVAEYHHFLPRFRMAMVIGVLLLIIGLVLAVWLGISYSNLLYSIVSFLIPAAVAIFIFIYFGMKHASFINYFRAKEVHEFLSPEMAKRLQRQKKRYREYEDERHFREFD